MVRLRRGFLRRALCHGRCGTAEPVTRSRPHVATIVSPVLGFALFTPTAVGGQIYGSVLIDHIGWLGSPQRPMNRRKGVALALLSAGVAMIVRVPVAPPALLTPAAGLRGGRGGHHVDGRADWPVHRRLCVGVLHAGARVLPCYDRSHPQIQTVLNTNLAKKCVHACHTCRSCRCCRLSGQRLKSTLVSFLVATLATLLASIAVGLDYRYVQGRPLLTFPATWYCYIGGAHVSRPWSHSCAAGAIGVVYIYAGINITQKIGLASFFSSVITGARPAPAHRVTLVQGSSACRWWWTTLACSDSQHEACLR